MNKGNCCCLQPWHVFISCLSSSKLFDSPIIKRLCESLVLRGVVMIWFHCSYVEGTAKPFFRYMLQQSLSIWCHFESSTWLFYFLCLNFFLSFQKLASKGNDCVVSCRLFLLKYFGLSYWNLKWKVVKGERRLIGRFDLLIVDSIKISWV